ncbi:hypothetical protein BDW02DRAFT_249508 [Decorospora gaudefroyi]|uniref:Zn(2)-C6 fungal-type domain-containing protein n=1 Tax=Decorospora gaudefroyi TaxID=184978 RepID=A0A6A5KK19_9PLEO|nr:hypothetical protein BDW02DRAFT_249508 [Decorospora gaudefroyi]
MPTQSHAKRRSAAHPEEKPVKRTRVSRACDQCRVARERCDGLQPTCSTCSGTTRRCSYTANPKRRGIQPGYIRTLELALAWLFQQNTENETSLNEELARDGPSSLLLSRNSKESNKLHRRWRKAQFYVEVDKQLSGGEPSRHEQIESTSPHSSDEVSDVEAPSITNVTRNQDRQQDKEPDIGSSGAKQVLAVPEGCTSRSHMSTPMPPDSWKLFEIYFTNTQPWLPICEKHDVLKLAYSYPLQKLPIAVEQPDSGAHAELWSILAVASLYDSSTNCSAPPDKSSTRPTKLYETAKSMVPSEIGHFEIGHIKALLNLAVFNMAQSLTGAAWLLVGCAARVLEIMDQQTLLANPRHKHVYSGCFILDGMLALQLNRRPHLLKSDLEHIEAIDEDSLEEWQPWSGFDNSLHEGTRSPLLSLSTFNNLVELVDILLSLGQPPMLSYRKDIAERLERWKASLPAKLGHLHFNSAFAFFTPPAALLHVTYHCSWFAANPSDSSLSPLLEVLEQCQMQLGLQRLPPTIKCLIEVVDRLTIHLVLDDSARTRLQMLRTGIMGAWPRPIVQGGPQIPDTSVVPYRGHTTSVQTPTPDSVQSIFPNPQPVDQLAALPLATILPAPHLSTGSLLRPPSPRQTDPRFPEATSEFENFFDELASLDSATRPDNQPQFMQNLGFGPEASMADLFSEYVPMKSSAFLAHDSTAPVGFDQYSFYTSG